MNNDHIYESHNKTLLMLENTNLSYAIRPIPDKGNLRETFLFGQLLNAGLDVFEPHNGDFLVGDITIEVGGNNKTAKQVNQTWL